MSEILKTTQHLQIAYQWAINNKLKQKLAGGTTSRFLTIVNCGWPLSRVEFDMIVSKQKDNLLSDAGVIATVKQKREDVETFVEIVFLLQLRAPDDE